MTTVALLSVAPVIEDSMAEQVAKAVEALEDHDVSYETTAMGTIIEAEDAATVFRAAASAHDAVDAERVSTLLKIDDKRATESSAAEKVSSVEDHLGRSATSERSG